jgi:mRNA surveillance protein pelota
MKIVFKDLKQGKFKVLPTSQDDLWLLSQLISKGATCGSFSTRKIKISETKVEKKSYYIELLCEKSEYENNVLRISGKSISEIEDIPKGSYHTLTIDIYDELTIIQKWLKFQLDKLLESTSEMAKVLLVALDRHEVYFAKIEQDSYKLISSFEGEVSGKAFNTKEKGNFYQDIEKTILEYDSRFKLDKIVVASPAFFKDDFYKQIQDQKIKKMIVLATCSTVSESCFNEILKRDEVKTALDSFRARQELMAVEELFLEIAKDGKYAYGLIDVKTKSHDGSIIKLLISTNFIHAKRQDNSYSDIENMMINIEDCDGKVIIVDSKNDAGKKLDGISGIGAILRYKKY